MNFKTVGFGAIAGATMAAGVAVVPAAEASTLAPGTFNIKGASSLSDYTGPTDTSFELNLTGFNFSSKTPVLAGLTGTPSVSSLSITRSGTSYTYGSVTEFIKGISLGGKSVVYDLNAGSFGGSDFAANLYSFAGKLQGVLRYSDGSEAVVGDGLLGAFNFSQFNGNNEANIAIETTVVPTPALLPGLLALGVGVLRKRKADANDQVKADA